MKITALDMTNKPLVNTKLQLQIKGSQGGFLTLTTGSKGEIILDDKYKGQQLLAIFDGIQSSMITANDGGTLRIETKTKEKEKTRETWK